MYFLVFLAVALAGLTALFWSGRAPAGRGAQPGVGGLMEADPVLPPVLLAEHPGRADVERIRFASGLRGYRMDQVDEVLEVLARALEERDLIIASLTSRTAPSAGPAPAGADMTIDVKDAVQD